MVRTKKIPFLESSPSRTLIATTLGAVVVAWGIVYSPLHTLFGLLPLSISPVLSILALTIVYLVLIEYAKRWFYKQVVID